MIVSGLNHVLHDGSSENDPPDGSLKKFIKDLFSWKVSSESQYNDSMNAKSSFNEGMNNAIEAGKIEHEAMFNFATLPFGIGEIETAGWISRSTLSGLDTSIQKKFISAMGKGIVSPTGKQGIIKLTASEIENYGGQYTFKLKILGKGGDYRILGKQLENGLYYFNKIITH